MTAFSRHAAELCLSSPLYNAWATAGNGTEGFYAYFATERQDLPDYQAWESFRNIRRGRFIKCNADMPSLKTKQGVIAADPPTWQAGTRRAKIMPENVFTWPVPGTR
ncbi:hypothetical protein EB241_14345 [Erwinia psidii]|uniref:Uncharacterized protein n=1 Tax=Erwinia psidii TaxID=69224 RepID=A0A3N6UNC7_9GAMM|nr:hypothetical protein EB241_14345 [Erwinia psidii]